VDEIRTEQRRHERQLHKPINGSEQPKTESPLSDSNRRPLPYHGSFRFSRAFTDDLRRAQNPCKELQSGVSGRGGRFAVVVDLVDAEWTRCTRRLPFRMSRADTGPRRAGGGGAPGPPDAVWRDRHLARRWPVSDRALVRSRPARPSRASRAAPFRARGLAHPSAAATARPPRAPEQRVGLPGARGARRDGRHRPIQRPAGARRSHRQDRVPLGRRRRSCRYERGAGRDEPCYARSHQRGSFAGEPQIAGTVLWTTAGWRVVIEGRRGDVRFDDGNHDSNRHEANGPSPSR
jgi:hypothetical protein